MASTPSENTLTVNNTHQMLSDLESYFQTLSVLSPSRNMENVLGYDINLPLVKSVVFQYKRPYTVQNDSTRRFSLNSDQWRTLVGLYDRGEAFFTFPEVINHNNLHRTLQNTVFVDVYAFKTNSSLAYVPKNACKSKSLGRLEAKVSNGKRYPLNRSMVYSWKDLKQEIDSCDIGLKIKENGERTGDFRDFEERVDNLADDDIEFVIERIREASSENIDGEDDVDYETMREELRELTESGTDLSTYGIGRSNHALLSR